MTCLLWTHLVQSRALVFGHAEAKLDMSQSGLCAHCGEPDTPRHRVCHRLVFKAARARREGVIAQWDSLPVCLMHHLFPPECPQAVKLRKHLHTLPGFETTL